VHEVRRRLADGVVSRPVQRPLPLAVGAMSARGLAVAAEHADIVSFAGLRQMAGGPPGALTMATGDETDELVDRVRCIRGERPYEADMLLQAVEIGVDPSKRRPSSPGAPPDLTRNGCSTRPSCCSPAMPVRGPPSCCAVPSAGSSQA
jgi:hypothetical protein